MVLFRMSIPCLKARWFVDCFTGFYVIKPSANLEELAIRVLHQFKGWALTFY